MERRIFDPESIFADPTLAKVYETADLEIHGPPEEKVDILFLAEGYTEAEMEKFMGDARRSMEYIFSEEPFKSRRKDFNMRAVKSVGPDSGTDIPGDASLEEYRPELILLYLWNRALYDHS